MFKNQMTLLDAALKKKMLPAIDTFPNPFPKKETGAIRIVFPEFTCVCPKTGYPDFASIDLYYVPTKLCIELKAWKLYLNSFRMIGTFHETVTHHIFSTVKKEIAPAWLLVAGDFFPRGNVNTTVILEEGIRPSSADFLIKEYKTHTTTFSQE